MIVVIQGKRYHCLLHLCYLFPESSHSLCCPLSLQSNRELPSRRSITPLRDIGVSARDFTGFSTTVPSPRTSRYLNTPYFTSILIFTLLVTSYFC
uniref:Uncharacterized protein n=1 Tax=Aegilops tauschii subsp. strangulata TaxID=200361 RepID=A0A453C0W2_AEGTS